MSYIVISEVSRKQDYIFKSNRLAENVGASSIIKYVTEELPQKYITNHRGREIYEGGGKSLYIFENEADAKKFTGEYSREVLRRFPGIELFITGVNYDEDNEEVSAVIDAAYRKLAVKKSERRHIAGMLGYGINKTCYSTGLPAYTTYNKGKRNSLISREIYEKLQFNSDGRNTTKDYQEISIEGFKFPKDLDELGRSKNEKSYIAVVHIDGNKMGRKLEQFKRENSYSGSGNLREHNLRYISKLNEFSRQIKNAYIHAFKSMNQYLANRIDKLSEELDIESNVLPIRPLILAGDDVCFVSDARVALECSKVFIENLNRYNFTGGTLHACAGIAIVKSHYPFARAYEMAEQLCQNAKNEIEGEDASLIDWHIFQGEISENIYAIRNKYYYGLDGGKSKLNMRPLYLDSSRSWRNYSNFTKAIKDITRNGVARSKIKGLRAIMREGKNKTELYVKANNLGSIIHRFADVQGSYGFTTDNVSMYYDAIELMDFYLDI